MANVIRLNLVNLKAPHSEEGLRAVCNRPFRIRLHVRDGVASRKANVCNGGEITDAKTNVYVKRKGRLWERNLNLRPCDNR
jgi:hypothetical protein